MEVVVHHDERMQGDVVIAEGGADLKPMVTKMTAAIIEVVRLNEPDEDIVRGSNGRQRAAPGIKQGLDAFLNQRPDP